MMIRAAIPLIAWVFCASAQAQHKKVVFAQHVLPMLKNKCFKCHKEAHMEGGKLKKPKGGLRLDAAAGIIRGSDSGRIVKPGKPKDSILFQAVMLPPEHDDVMPPKPPFLSKGEKVALALWIAQGAKFNGWRGNEKGFGETVGGSDFSRTSFAGGMPPELGDKLEKMGAKVTVSGKVNLISVEFISQTTKVKNETIASLAPIAPKLIELSLPRARITDESMSTIATMTRLTWLDLRGTPITDSGLAHIKGLQGLTYLNLYGTKITDQGLAHLAGMKKLDKVFLFGTQVSSQGVARLKKLLPKAELNL